MCVGGEDPPAGGLKSEMLDFPLISHAHAHWKNKKISRLYTPLLMTQDKLVIFIKL